MNYRDIQLDEPKKIINKASEASEKNKEADGGLVVTVFKNRNKSANSSQSTVKAPGEKIKAAGSQSPNTNNGYGRTDYNKRDNNDNGNYPPNDTARTSGRRETRNDYGDSRRYYGEKRENRLNDETKRKLKKAIIIILSAVAFIIACFALYIVMTIKEIEITGNENISTDSIKVLSGVDIGTNALIGVDESNIRSNIESNPELELLSIEYIFPSKLIINVEEHMPCAEFNSNGKYITIDSGGKVIDISASGSCAEIIGINAVSYKVNEVIKTDNDKAMESLKKLISALDYYNLCGLIKEIDMTNYRSISYRYHSGMLIKIGDDDDIEKKVLFADKVREKLEKEGITTGQIDVSYVTQAIYTPAVRSAETDGNTGNSYKLNYNLYELDDENGADTVTAEEVKTEDEEETNTAVKDGENG